MNLLDLQMLQNQSDSDDDDGDMDNGHGDSHNGGLDLDETQLKGEWSYTGFWSFTQCKLDGVVYLVDHRSCQIYLGGIEKPTLFTVEAIINCVVFLVKL